MEGSSKQKTIGYGGKRVREPDLARAEKMKAARGASRTTCAKQNQEENTPGTWGGIVYEKSFRGRGLDGKGGPIPYKR